jgi:hypothetical protein
LVAMRSAVIIGLIVVGALVGFLAFVDITSPH